MNHCQRVLTGKERTYFFAIKYILEKKPKHLTNKIAEDYKEWSAEFLADPVNLIKLFLDTNFKTDEDLKRLDEYIKYLQKEELTQTPKSFKKMRPTNRDIILPEPVKKICE